MQRPQSSKLWTPQPQEKIVHLRVVNAYYYEEGDTVTFQCVEQNGTETYLHWPRTKWYNAMMGRTGPDRDVPPSIVKDVLPMYVGKNITHKKIIVPEGSKNSVFERGSARGAGDLS